MLQELDIRNYALIDKVKINFSTGLNILTGETGAGKSIIIGAMGLILGERTSADAIRTGENNANVRTIIDISGSSRAITALSQLDLENEDDINILLLSREISKSGRTRCWVNDQAATISTLRQIGDRLIDIHGQHEHQTLFRQEEHLNILDSFGGLKSLRQKVADLYGRLQELQSDYDQLVRDRDDKLRQKELLEFQLKELEDTRLEESEEERLLRERQILNNAELIFELTNNIYERLYDSEDPNFLPVLDIMKSMRTDLAKLRQIDSQTEEMQSRFEAAIYELEDIAAQIMNYRDNAEFDPRKIADVEARLDLIYKLKRKYRVDSVAGLISHKTDVAGKLEDISLSSSRIDDIRQEIQKTNQEAREVALELSQQRQHHAKRLKLLVEKELYTLGMEKTVFEVEVIQNGEMAPISSFYIESDGKMFRLGEDGIDSIEFLISPNVGEELRPLTRIASGGEISRVMLAIKTVLATGSTHTSPSIMIFDEIDTGIGGRIAEVVGRKLKELSKSRQVICITHLPQIASLADSHCLVQKKVVGDRTVVEVQKLDYEERVNEIARMLAGERITEVTVAHAREMIEQAV